MLPEHLSGGSSKFHFISGCPSYFLKHLGRFQTLRRTPLCTEKPVYGYRYDDSHKKIDSRKSWDKFSNIIKNQLKSEEKF